MSTSHVGLNLFIFPGGIDPTWILSFDGNLFCTPVWSASG
jgi:hypothetical protein